MQLVQVIFVRCANDRPEQPPLSHSRSPAVPCAPSARDCWQVLPYRNWSAKIAHSNFNTVGPLPLTITLSKHSTVVLGQFQLKHWPPFSISKEPTPLLNIFLLKPFPLNWPLMVEKYPIQATEWLQLGGIFEKNFHVCIKSSTRELSHISLIYTHTHTYILTHYPACFIVFQVMGL